MSKRVQLTLPDTIYDDLEQWAKEDGRPLANLCNFLLERAVMGERERREVITLKAEQKKKGTRYL